jgi:uncharacterized SAM-binding protein YcdF (DUF218 family)
VLGLLLSLFGVLSLAATGGLVTVLRISRPRREAPAAAEAIVVFGAGVLRDGTPCPELRARLEHAAQLYAEGWAPRVVCSGGAREVAAMCAFLAGRARVEGDPRGVSTRATLEGLSGRGPVLLVSSPWHAHRIRAEAARQGVDARVCPAPSSPLAEQPRARRRQLAREVVASWWYAVSAA